MMVTNTERASSLAGRCSRFAVRSATLRFLRRPRNASHRDAATTFGGNKIRDE
jgi:hypothetical protein